MVPKPNVEDIASIFFELLSDCRQTRTLSFPSLESAILSWVTCVTYIYMHNIISRIFAPSSIPSAQ